MYCNLQATKNAWNRGFRLFRYIFSIILLSYQERLNLMIKKKKSLRKELKTTSAKSS